MTTGHRQHTARPPARDAPTPREHAQRQLVPRVPPCTNVDARAPPVAPRTAMRGDAVEALAWTGS